MGVIELEVTRTVPAPVEDVFARLADIEGHNAWMPRSGSILRRTRQTSAGATGLGTTYLDHTLLGPTPGEVVVFDPPSALGYHWWTRSRRGRLHVQGWPGYVLAPDPDGGTRVRHHARTETYGAYRVAGPVLRRIALRERTATVDALVRSFTGATGG
ncbi:SRPBCC family protein [Pedococcus sp. NPDC057267]|uniref:SRPBCC family protein n=1 Tax=Pedococcus sp. NPDC057267 TaxID=3346077 RepID=UPI003631C14C